MLKSIEWKDGKVFILDQSLLPHRIEYIECTDYPHVAEAIKTLKIRGAPAIGIAAAMGVALGAERLNTERESEFLQSIDSIIEVMLRTRPTAVNIRWAMDRLKRVIKSGSGKGIKELKELLKREALKILEEDIEINRSIGLHGLPLIKEGINILTHCNAGALATGGYGTVTAPMFIAREKGIRFHVFVDETRPVLQGARLTTLELLQAGIDCTLITDNSAGALMKKGLVNLIIVGADRVTRKGDVANKIGTYSLAIIAKENNIPFYIAAPLSSIDFTIDSGDDIPIEERPEEEVTTIMGVRIAPEGIKVKNMAFDVTPARYITGIITEKGIFKPEDISRLEGQ
ncbi:MAG: S-methyl-5-thioribose-1-phosphate isomerase [Thermodesulfovibrionales bacterium]